MPLNIFSNIRESKYKLIILGLLTLATLIIAIKVNIVLGVDVVYTHLFYIPLILAGIWFYKKAVYAAIFLGAFHVLINYAYSGTFIYGTFFRAAFFILIAYIVGAIAEKKDRLYAELKTSESQLRQMRDTLEQRVRERTAELNATNETLKSEIAEREKAEKALRKSRAILARAQDIAHVGNWAWDLKTNRVQWSDEVYRIYGYRPGELLPAVDQLISAAHPGDREMVRKTMEEALHQNKLFNIDFRIVLADGSVRYVNSVADKFRRDPEGNPIKLYGIIQDITGRKQVEEALRGSEER